MARLRFQESLPVMQSYAVALFASLVALVVLALATVVRVPMARPTLLQFGRWFVFGLAYVSLVVFLFSWGSLPGNLPRVIRRLDPATVAEEPLSASTVTVVEVLAILGTYAGIVGFGFFVVLPGVGACPADTVGAFSRWCTLAQSLGMTELFGLGLYDYAGLYLLAQPLWVLVWLFE